MNILLRLRRIATNDGQLNTSVSGVNVKKQTCEEVDVGCGCTVKTGASFDFSTLRRSQTLIEIHISSFKCIDDTQGCLPTLTGSPPKSENDANR